MNAGYQQPLESDLDSELITRLRSLREVHGTPDVQAEVLSEVGLADRYFSLDTVAGEVFIAYNHRGISYIERVEDVQDFESDFRSRFNRPAFAIDRPPATLLGQIEATLHGVSGRRPRFDLTSRTDFERSVLLKALEIPYGQVRPYNWIAGEIGKPKAQRAVGSALATNPIPLLIPCHRVVRSDGIIGNYGLGGTEVKRKILEAEGANPRSLESLARAGYRFVGSDTTHIFCFPTCGHARRVTERHEMRFASSEEARMAGYRPCKVCRPQV